MRSILIGLAILAITLPAKAEEVVLHEAVVVEGGLMCNTVEEVKSFIGVQESRSGDIPPGCGLLQVPVALRVISLGTYETRRRTFLLVRFEFLSVPMPVQYGIGEVRDNGEPI